MAADQVTFGRPLRDSAFLLDPTSVHINQGSWGCVPKSVFEAQIKLKARIEFQPDHYFRCCIEKEWFSSLDTVCKFLHLKPENTAFLDNVTTGVNAVMKSLPLKRGDQILVYSWTFYANVNTAHQVAESTGAEVLTLELEYPIRKQVVVEKYRNMLASHPNIKIAIVDYISGPIAVLFPVNELVQLCKEYNVMSLVDGAHTPGHIEPMVEDIMPDFYTGNLHKWVFCPRPCAILWVNPKHHDIIRPLVTSHYYKQPPWQKEFYEQGTRNCDSYLTSPNAIRFFQSLGGLEHISEYVTSLLDEAVQVLVEKWGTKTFEIPHDMEAPFMRMVRLPDSHYHTPSKSKKVPVLGFMNQLMFDLYDRFNIHTFAFTVQDKPWIRISGTVYNYLEEYQKLAEAVLTLMSEQPFISQLRGSGH